MLRCLATLALVAPLLAACGDNQPGSAAALAIDPGAASLPIGRDLALHAAYKDDDGRPASGAALTWTSSDPDVATVSAGDGGAIVHAVALGSAVITARVGELEEVALISVRDAELDALAIDPPELAVPDGLCATVTAIATRSDGTSAPVEGSQVIWTGSTGVFAVGFDGTICATTLGGDTIHARYGGQVADAEATGAAAVPERLQIDPGFFFSIGETNELFVFLWMSDGQLGTLEGPVTCTIDDPSVAVLAAVTTMFARVTSVGPGTTTIHASYLSFTAQATIEVFELAPD